MRNRTLWSWIGVLSIIATVAISPATFAQPAATDDTADLGFLESLSKDHQTILVVNDPLPHLQKMLTSAALRRVLMHESVRAVFDGGATDPAELWQMIEPNQRWVPQQIVVGVPDQYWEAADHLIGTGLLLGLSSAANNTGSDDAKKHLTELREQLATEIQGVQIPRFTLYAKFRDAQDAASLMAMMQMHAANTGELPVKIKSDPDRISMDQVLSDFIGADDLAEGLKHWGAFDDENSPAAIAMTQALANMRLQFSIHRSGAALIFTVGPITPADQPHPSRADLGDLFKLDADTLIFAKWDCTRLIDCVDEWNAVWAKWADTEIGKELLKADIANLLPALENAPHELAATTARGTSRTWVDGATLRHLQRGQGFKTVPSIATTKLAELIPAGFDCYEADTVQSLAGRVKAAFADAAGAREEPDVEAIVKHFSPLRDKVLEEIDDVFKPGFLALTGTRGQVKQFDLAFTADGKRQAIHGEDLPTIEFALVSRTGGAERTRKFLDETYREMINASLRVAEIQAEGNSVATKSVDLGLGVPTWDFDSAWIKKISGKSEAEWKLEGDLHLHFFFVDDAMVLSSSARLSKEMLAAKNGAKPRLALSSDEAGEMVGGGLVGGKTLTEICTDLATWMKMLSDNIEPKDQPDRSIAEGANLLTAFSQIMSLVDEVRWQTNDAKDTRTMKASIRFTK